MVGGKRCSVGICKSQEGKDKDLSFFSFPKNADIRKQWIQKCNRKDKINPEYARICSRHFLPTDYERNLKAELLNCPYRKKLKVNVVPSQLLKSGQIIQEPTSRDERVLKKEQKRLISEINETTKITTETTSSEEPGPSHQKTFEELNYELQQVKIENENLKRSLKEANEIKDNIVRDLNSKIKILEEKIDKSKADNLTFYEKVKTLFSNQFTQNQIDLVMKNKKTVKWTAEELSHAFTLRYYSKRCYIYLRQALNYPLPGISTLQRWAGAIDMRKGLLHEVLLFMNILGESLSILERVTILSFDEMKIESVYEYDQKEDEVVGPHRYMQVVMARGLFHKWKQPVYINFDTTITPQILNNIIDELHKISFTVVACVSDCGGGNIGLWKNLKISTENVFFRHPITNENIYMFADCPHLLKLIRNWLIDTGFILEDETKITKVPLENLIKETDSEINSCHRLKNIHIECFGSQRQNVALAAQLLSHTTATALKIYKPGPDQDSATNLGMFVELINSWFDIMNATTITANIRKKPYMGTENQVEILQSVINLAKTMRCTGKRNLQIFQKGLIISTTSIQLLFNDLCKKFDIKYVLTHRLNQDVLENFFSQIRTRGGLHDHPSPLNALYRIRMILLGKSLTTTTTPSTSNTTPLEETEYILTKVFKKAKVNTIPAPVNQEFENQNESSESESSSSSLTVSPPSKTLIQQYSEKDGIRYLAGYIAKKLQKKHPGLGNPTKVIPNSLVPSWLQHLSFGGLIEPTEQFLHLITDLEKHFQHFHKNETIRSGKNIMKRTANNLKEKLPDVEFDITNLFVRYRIFIRIKRLNFKLQEKTLKLKRKTTASSSQTAKKMRKTTN